ncbi:MAG: NfeD family protein [Vampirovibrionales bacterium]|nr:NfeD family protein [Vampirovibrionales bacterium]
MDMVIFGLDVPQSVLLWVGLAVMLSVLEIFTAGFFCMFFALGALLAACLAWVIPLDYGLQGLVFVIGSLLSLLWIRPFLKKTLNITDKPLQDSNVQALIGQVVLVLEPVEKYSGQVKVIHTGEVWSAYLCSENNTDVLAPGQEGVITRVDGAKLAVSPKS